MATQDSMPRITRHGSRADLLLVLARQALPNALRRSDQPPAVAIGLALLYLVAATVATLAVLPLLLGVEDELLRRNLFNLAAGAVTLLWLLAQVVVRIPMSWLLDLEPLLPLPAAWRDLFLLRLGFSLVGNGLLLLGPAALYLLATRPEGPLDVLLASSALAAAVLLLGRIAAILLIAVDRLVEGTIGMAALLLLVIAAVQAGGVAIRIADGELDVDTVTAAIRDADTLAMMGYLPLGLAAAVLDAPGATGPNLLRLGVLLVLLAATAGVEYRLLLRQYLTRPGGDRRTAAPVTPLAWLLRRRGRLSSAAGLTLVELECCLRAKGIRWGYVTWLGYATFVRSDFLLGVTLPVLCAVLLGCTVRADKPPRSCQVWRESHNLPLRAFRIFRIPASMPMLFAVPVLVLGTGLGLAYINLASEWPLILLALALSAATLLFADAAYGVVQLYWPGHKVKEETGPKMENIAASLLAAHCLVACMFLTVLAWRVMQPAGAGYLAATAIAGASLLVAGLVWRLSTARQRREIDSRAHELLLQDPTH